MSDIFSFRIPDSVAQLHCNSHLINSSQSSLSTQVQHWVIKMRHGSSPTSLCVTGVWQWCWHKPICMCNSAKVVWQHFLSCNSHLKSLVDLRSRVYCQSEGEFTIHVNEQTKKKKSPSKRRKLTHWIRQPSPPGTGTCLSIPECFLCLRNKLWQKRLCQQSRHLNTPVIKEVIKSNVGDVSFRVYCNWDLSTYLLSKLFLLS